VRTPDEYTERELARVELRMEILDEGELFICRLRDRDPNVRGIAWSELSDAGWTARDVRIALDALSDQRRG
jgi:hypothetical protein